MTTQPKSSLKKLLSEIAKITPYKPGFRRMADFPTWEVGEKLHPFSTYSVQEEGAASKLSHATKFKSLYEISQMAALSNCLLNRQRFL